MYIISGYHFNEFKVKGSLFKIYTYEANYISDIKEKISQLENRFSVELS